MARRHSAYLTVPVVERGQRVPAALLPEVEFSNAAILVTERDIQDRDVVGLVLSNGLA
jgi:hypothetical protein